MSELDPLFYWRGIAPDYINYKGEHVTIPLENKMKLLDAMQIDVKSSDSIQDEIHSLDVAPWLTWLRPFSICKIDKPFFDICLSPSELNTDFKWNIYDNKGDRVDSGEFYGITKEETGNYLYQDDNYSRRRVPININTPGYYRLHLMSAGKEVDAALALSPETAFNPTWAKEEQKIWGLIIHLYTLRSQRNWGIGDFTDLYNLIDFISGEGAGVIGLNPLHALSAHLHDSFSPYSPSDRRFINALYIDIENISNFESGWLDGDVKQKINRLHDDDYVNYHDVANIKYPQLQKSFFKCLSNSTSNHFSELDELLGFIKKIGQPIIDYAIYEENNQRWNVEASSDVDSLTLSDAILAFEKGLHKNVLFYCYIQWLADSQLKACQYKAEVLGMEIGLVKDLAVGADGGGAEISTNSELFRRKASIGAPPDPMALTGQNWGIPPMDPATLKHTGFAHYIALLRANMSRCGALRIDHAMSLMRLWWCPLGENADAGAYVYYPFEEMLGLLCLESYLNHCVIIGEDLGVVPGEFRDAISKTKIFSNKVFYFEKDFDGNFRRPEHYEPHALAMVNNHDVPTLLSWWNGTDLSLRNELNLLEAGVAYEDICKGREDEKQKLVALLKEYNLYPDSWQEKTVSEPADEALIFSILEYVSQSASQIFVLQLEDLMLMNDPVNVPGTFREHKNWQRKLTINIEDLAQNKNVKALLKAIQRRRQQ